MENAKLVNVANAFYEKRFNDLCAELEAGETVTVYVDCIGHTRNNMVQESYKNHLIEKYGDRITITRNEGGYCWDYTYKLA